MCILFLVGNHTITTNNTRFLNAFQGPSFVENKLTKTKRDCFTMSNQPQSSVSTTTNTETGPLVNHNSNTNTTVKPKIPSRRVKLYHLNDEGKWDDKGTGHVACITPSDKGDITNVHHDEAYLVMRSEDDDRTLLESRVSDDDVYQLQGDTLIVWNDVDTGTEMALSFAQSVGCSDIWHEIESAQQSYRRKSAIAPNGTGLHRSGGGSGNGGDPTHLNEYDEISDDFDVEVSDLAPHITRNNNSGVGVTRTSTSSSNGSPVISLPDPELPNLPKIEETIVDATSSFRKEKITNLLLANNFLRKLLDIFSMCEDLEDIQSLRRLFRISRAIVSLNDANLLEILTSDEYFSDFIGTLEYDPELPLNPNSSHRTLFQASSRFKKLFSFSDSSLLPKIHCNFRLQFLRDVVLARFLEDSTLNTLNSLIYFNNVEIVGGIMTDDKFLDDMFHLILSADAPSEPLRNAFLFLQELNSLAKNLQPNRKTSFFKTLISKGLFDVLERYCTNEDLKIRQSVSELMSSLICHDPNQFRPWLTSDTQRKNNFPFFRNLITQLVKDPDTGMKAQFTEILRTILDPDTFVDNGVMNMLPDGYDKDDVLSVFYSDLLDPLVSVLTDDSDSKEALPCEDRPQTQYYICGLLSFFVQHHGYRIKFFVLRKNLCAKVLRLLHCPDKHLALAAIRFFRVCASMKDEFYNRHFIRSKLFDPIIEIFKANGSRYNLLNSAIIELFDFIRKENIAKLIEHLIEKYRDFFDSITYVDVFKGLITRYEQNKDHEMSLMHKSSASSVSDDSPRPTNKRLRLVDEDDDEAYFNEDDDEENTSIHSDEGASPTTRSSPPSPLSPPLSSSSTPSPSTSLTPIVSSALLLTPPKKKARLVEFGDECMPCERESPGCSF